MVNFLSQYYKGIIQQLRSEVDSINSLFQHQGLKGEGNETILRNMISKFIPQKYGVDTGIIIDKNGQVSRQCDIIIYDKLKYSLLLSMSTVHIFPVDIVYATIEVKTTLDSNQAKKALENIESVKKLEYINDNFNIYLSGEGAGQHVLKPTAPMGFVFAYNSNPMSAETFRDWFISSDTDFSYFPAMIACLDQGIVRFRSPFPEIPIDGELLKPEMKLFPLIENNKPIYLDDEDEYDDPYFHEGTIYPVKKWQQKNVPIDQSRVFLIFLLTLDKWLSYKILNPTIDFMKHYTSEAMQHVLDV